MRENDKKTRNRVRKNITKIIFMNEDERCTFLIRARLTTTVSLSAARILFSRAKRFDYISRYKLENFFFVFFFSYILSRFLHFSSLFFFLSVFFFGFFSLHFSRLNAEDSRAFTTYPYYTRRKQMASLKHAL